MNHRFALVCFLTLFLNIGLRAQGVPDALLFSQTIYEGTSRSIAMGNATGAMGGDVTAMCINPAGLGLYRSSEFTFTNGLQHHFCLSDYYDSPQYAQRTRMTIPNVGFVLSGEVSNYEALRYIQFGVGLTRTNDYNYRQKAKGLNPNSSMVDTYLQTANGIDELFLSSTDVSAYLNENYPYDLSPAWETFLIDKYVDDEGNLFFDSPIPAGNVYQEESITSKGRSEEWTFAVSTNLYDKLFLGTSLGLSHLKHIYSRTYTEQPGEGGSDTFFNWVHIENLEDTSWGVNLKFGLIYYPAQWLRIGMAWHSRTLYEFGETWATETQTMLKTNLGAQDYHRYLSPNLYQEYEFRTPHHFIGSLAFIIGRRGMVTTDIEYLDYGKSKFDFSGVNEDIEQTLKPSLNLRLGTEWRIRQFFLRGGVAYYGSPYGISNSDGSIKKLCLGIGYPTSEETSWDFAYELSQSTTSRTPYQCYADGAPLVDNILQYQWRNKFLVTLKVKL